MSKKRFSRQRFYKSLRLALLVEVAILIFIFILWIIFNRDNIGSYPFPELTLAVGGFFLATAGCIGPGRYRKEYNLVLYMPIQGSSFSEEIPVSGFTMVDGINSAEIFINGHKAGALSFVNQIGSTTLPREAIMEQTINSIYLESEGKRSNKSYFTVFDYTEEMSPDEIDELIALEENTGSKDIEEVKEDFIQRRFANVGSLSWGLVAASLISFIIGIIYDLFIR